MPTNNKLTVFVDPWSVLLTLGILLGIYILWTLNSLLFIVFLSFVISSTLRPFVKKIHDRFKISKPLIISGVFLVVFLVVSALGYLVVDNLSKEVKNLNVNEVVTDFLGWVDNVIPGDQSAVLNSLNSHPVVETTEVQPEPILVPENTNLFNWNSLLEGTKQVVGVLGKTLSGFVLIFTVIMISFYMLSRDEDVFDGLLKFLPRGKRDLIKRLLTKIEGQLGAWLGAQLFLMILIGVLTYIGLVLPSIFVSDEFFVIGRFALTLAVIAGILELIPGIGPTITMVIAIILSIATGGDNYLPQTIYVAIYFMAIQNIENTFIVPKLMKQAVGLDPIVTILSVMGAYTLMGPVGAIIIVPIIAAVIISVEFFAEENAKLKEGG